MHVIFIFIVTTTKQSSAEDILTLSDSKPHFTIPSISATLQVVINRINSSLFKKQKKIPNSHGD